jgi:hypothetical protein
MSETRKISSSAGSKSLNNPEPPAQSQPKTQGRDFEWRTRAEAMERRLRRKWGALSKDKEFIWETASLLFQLEEAYAQHAKEIESFFKPVFNPPAPHMQVVTHQIRQLQSKPLRRLLRRYVRYVARFGVTMSLRTWKRRSRVQASVPSKKSRFRVQAFVPEGPIFHVRLNRDYFEPGEPFVWDGHTPCSAFFESEKINAPSEVQKLIDAGAAAYVVIDDRAKWSVLQQLIDFAYDPDKVTFIYHNARRPNLFCLVGEGMRTKEVWQKVARAVDQFQKQGYGRTAAGRPPDLRRLVKRLHVLRKPGTLKQKAIAVARGTKDTDVFAEQVTLSKMKKRLKS